ncbi:MAG: hypothetical protein ACR2QE_15625 [Acidimicrobiales bacterium]
MARRRKTTLPTGTTPWDPLNGFRIGAMAGGLVSAGVVAATGAGGIGVVLGVALGGGAIGYWVEKRRITQGRGDDTQ